MDSPRNSVTGAHHNAKQDVHPRQETLNSIQALRGVAALLVVFFHGTRFFGDFHIAPFNGFFLFGFSGVHLFFVLSGFLIFTIHFVDIGKPQKYLTYIKKRFIRIYPTYWVILALLSYLGLTDGTPTTQAFYQNMAILPAPPLGYINPVCWTLWFEILFYILFSVLVLNRMFGIILIAYWVLLVALTNFFGFHTTAFISVACHKNVTLFMMGMAAAYTVMQLKTFKTAIKSGFGYVAGMCGVLIFAATVFYYLTYRPENSDSWPITLGFGAGSALLLAGSLSDGLEEFLKQRKILLAMGDASYSIYLLHYFVLKFAIVYLMVKHPVTNLVLVTIAFVVICSLTALTGWLFYRFVERPLLKFAHRHLLSTE